MTFHNAQRFVYDGEIGWHRLVVGDTLGVVAFYDAMQRVWCLNGFFLHHLIVFDGVEDNFWRDDRQAAYFLVCKKLVGNFDYALLAYLFGREIVANGYLRVQVMQVEQSHHLICFVGGYVVNNGAILNGGDLQFFFSHLDNYAIKVKSCQPMIVLSARMSLSDIPKQ